jgi:hypothetical protein
MPVRLRYVAIRFAVRPTAENGERFDRFALYDLDAARRRDPAWYDAFDVYTRDRAAVPHVKKAMRQLVAHQTTRIPSADLDRISAPTTLLWGARTAWFRFPSRGTRRRARVGRFVWSTTQAMPHKSNSQTRSSTGSR